jgi:hypothetical protein
MDDENKGMTVNERLWVGGLSVAFDKAVDEKNVRKVTEILEKIGLTELSITPILRQLGLVTHEA